MQPYDKIFQMPIDSEAPSETLKTPGSSNVSSSTISLQDAVKLGEYKPEVLSGYPEWHKLSKYAQFELISQAVEHRRRQLMNKWAEVDNFTNAAEDPTLKKQAQKNIQEQLKKLSEDKEKLYLEYSKTE